jgi:hypothetical protein
LRFVVSSRIFLASSIMGAQSRRRFVEQLPVQIYLAG